MLAAVGHAPVGRAAGNEDGPRPLVPADFRQAEVGAHDPDAGVPLGLQHLDLEEPLARGPPEVPRTRRDKAAAAPGPRAPRSRQISGVHRRVTGPARATACVPLWAARVSLGAATATQDGDERATPGKAGEAGRRRQTGGRRAARVQHLLEKVPASPRRTACRRPRSPRAAHGMSGIGRARARGARRVAVLRCPPAVT